MTPDHKSRKDLGGEVDRDSDSSPEKGNDKGLGMGLGMGLGGQLDEDLGKQLNRVPYVSSLIAVKAKPFKKKYNVSPIPEHE